MPGLPTIAAGVQLARTGYDLLRDLLGRKPQQTTATEQNLELPQLNTTAPNLRQTTTPQLQQLASTLRQNFQPGANALEQPFFRGARGQLLDLGGTLNNQVVTRANQLGNRGSEFELAGRANTGQVLAGELRQLVQGAQIQQNAQEQAALQNLLSVLSQVENNERVRFQSEVERRNFENNVQIVLDSISRNQRNRDQDRKDARDARRAQTGTQAGAILVDALLSLLDRGD